MENNQGRSSRIHGDYEGFKLAWINEYGGITMEALNEYEGKSIEECIKACNACYQECLKCLNHCLILGGEHSGAIHIKTLLECAQICNISSTLLRMEGKFSQELCQICARSCDECEASCLSIGKDDSLMLECARVCRYCAEACRTMAAQ
ncbi:MAG TPA: four-helix bundle copper-binding protein [Bacteriovoracaceae bacterium]|nr:four-helix bundle copper-binding protein [Bacteriovoracaceae bacterium]